MKLLLSIIIIGILLIIFEKQIKKYSSIFYIGAVIVGLLTVLLPQNIYPNWLIGFVTNYLKRGTIATALFIIVMYAVLMPRKSKLIRVFMGLRGEIAIIASLLILIHNISYGKYYFKTLFFNMNRLSLTEILAAIVSIIMILLLIPLTITSFKVVRKRIPAKKWKTIQRWSYLFYGLLYVHVAIIFSPKILAGDMSYALDMCIYTLIFGAYATLRIRKYLLKKSNVKIPRTVASIGSACVIVACAFIIVISSNDYIITNADTEEIVADSKDSDAENKGSNKKTSSTKVTEANEETKSDEIELDEDSESEKDEESDEKTKSEKTESDEDSESEKDEESDEEAESDETELDKDSELEKDEESDEKTELDKDSETEEATDILYKDGIWSGEGKGFMGTIKVEVTIEKGSIAKIKIVDYVDDYEYFSMAEEEIPDAIIDNQSTDVDTVSGATYSSKGIKKAVENALEKSLE